MNTQAETTQSTDELPRILSLPSRKVLNCERERGTRRWAPEAQALIDLMTEKYTRGPRLSCACRDRVVKGLSGGRILIFHKGRPDQPPPLPVETTVDAFCADNFHDAAATAAVRELRPGYDVKLPGLGYPACLTELNPVQAWIMRELPKTRGIFGLISVGFGKCLPAGNEIFDAKTGRRRDISEIGELSVPSMFDNKIANAKAVCFASGQKQCCVFTLSDGTDTTASLDHPVYTSSGWKHAGLLRTGDFVAVAGSVPEPQNQTLATDDEVKLIAYMLADGGCSGITPRFTNETESVLQEFFQLADSVCGGWSEHSSRSNARELSLLGSTSFRRKWSLYGLAKKKRLHPALWGLPRKQVALFLNRFWACDGYITDKVVEVTLASEQMIDDLQFLLLRLGIKGRKKFKDSKLKDRSFDAWRLTVTGADAVAFLAEVGDVLGKELACKKLREALLSTPRNANLDVVPFGDREFVEACDELGIPGRGYAARFSTRMRRTYLRKKFSVTAGQYLSRHAFIEFCKTTGYEGKYAHLANPSVRWERVVKNAPIGTRDVFDLEVPGSHNFVVNSGPIVHNTICGLLAPLAIPGIRTVVLLAKPNQRLHYRNAYLRLREHFKVTSFVLDKTDVQGASFIVPGTPVLHFVPYSLLSSQKSTELLDLLGPDMVIADESHLISSRTATRTMRFLRYMASRNDIVFCNWSGSTVKKTLNDASHLSAHSLGLGSPFPIRPVEVDKWAAVVDPSPLPDTTSDTAIALREAFDKRRVTSASPFSSMYNDGIREGLKERVITTPGVISTKSSAITCSISLSLREPPKMPDAVRKALLDVRIDSIRPDGEELVEAIDVITCAREVASGWYAYWSYPKGEPPELIEEWFAARKLWNKALRAKLRFAEPHLDSPLLCANAAERAWRVPKYEGPLPKWFEESWPAWARVKDLVQPDPRVRWIDDYLARDAAKWATENRGVVWCQSRALGLKIAQILKVPYHAGGPDGEARILSEKGDRSIVASIDAFGTGLDGLQFKFAKQLVTEPPASADRWEQLLGRLAREGQNADTVETFIYAHVPEIKDALAKAFMYAEFIEATTPNKQLLLAADRDFEL